MLAPNTVLITGTTTGIGKALLEKYEQDGWIVLAVDHRTDPQRKTSSQVYSHVVDITSYEAVSSFLSKLEAKKMVPSLVILNAGINRPDNLPGAFDFETFQTVMNVNLTGAFTFIAAIRKLGVKGVRFVGISSTSNTIPNPGHLGYYLSKWGIYKGFEFLQKNDSSNRYQSVVLGPVHTDIMRSFTGPQGFQRKIFNFLADDKERTAKEIAAFAQTRKPVLHYPIKARIFYSTVKWLLLFLPALYAGTKVKHVTK